MNPMILSTVHLNINISIINRTLYLSLISLPHQRQLFSAHRFLFIFFNTFLGYFFLYSLKYFIFCLPSSDISVPIFSILPFLFYLFVCFASGDPLYQDIFYLFSSPCLCCLTYYLTLLR